MRVGVLAVLAVEAALRYALFGHLGMALLHGMGGEASPWLAVGGAWLLVRPLALVCGGALAGHVAGLGCGWVGDRIAAGRQVTPNCGGAGGKSGSTAGPDPFRALTAIADR